MPEIPFRLDPSACDQCGECVKACSAGALALSGSAVAVDPRLCDGCEDCVLACPTPALASRPIRPWAAAAGGPAAPAGRSAPGGAEPAGAGGAPGPARRPPARILPIALRAGPKWRIWDLVAAGAILLALQLTLNLVAGAARGLWLSGAVILAETLVFYGLLVAVVEAFARARRVDAKQLGFAPFKAGRSVVAITGLMVLMLVAREEYVQLVRVFGFSPPSVERQLLKLFGAGLGGFTVALLVTVVVAPVVEELFFRGFVYGVLRERLAVGWAMLLSALIFAIYHFSLWLVVPIVLLGIALAWLVEWQHSIWPAVICHAVNNLLAVLVVYWPAISAASRSIGTAR